MIRNDHFSHASRDGTAFSRRMKRAAYTPSGMSVHRTGGNTGGGYGSRASPQIRRKARMDSPGRRENILGPGFRHAGIGVEGGVYQCQSGYGTYTVDFGFRRGYPVASPQEPRLRGLSDAPSPGGMANHSHVPC